MSKKDTLDIAKPNVAGALSAIRSKKSREQIKLERLKPFVPVINEALKSGWKWSPIVTLIRENGGPVLSKKKAETLYQLIKSQCLPDANGKAGEGAPTSREHKEAMHLEQVLCETARRTGERIFVQADLLSSARNFGMTKPGVQRALIVLCSIGRIHIIKNQGKPDWVALNPMFISGYSAHRWPGY
ncbi:MULTISPECIES: hypothetical protein [unclassified Burkholderia]|uniref:hypothetical protein n=1 Tax=unclassified Burkholderia TaxID=2613784 RepID=UPI000756923C|nr:MULTISPECIES: hypothetical protein [unclassified Burkholderia]KVN17521.1 hypothetical protein WT08_00040 [Burkholderia sp. MSMB1552]KWZ51891.1 hypothetical protein WS92_17780 [Burkholderia sp. MSMB1588]